MKKIIYGAMAAAALLACSKEQVIEQNRANDEIRFSVVAENQTKAADVYTSTNMMEAFTVAATYTKGSETSWYFQEDNIKYQNSAWVNTTDTRYWSADGSHDFYAIVNGTMTLGETDEEVEVTVNFTPDPYNVTKQKDLLYAVTKGLGKSDNQVALKFRHALSQIQFMAKNTNSQLHVKISDVQVGNIPGVGTFTYPRETNGDGKWTYNTPTDYTVNCGEVAVAGNNSSVALTCTTGNSLLLIPAKTTPWDPTTGGGNNGEGGEGNGEGGEEGEPGEGDGGNNGEGTAPPINEGIGGEPGDGDELTRSGNVADVIEGSYLAVKCKIYNVAGGTYKDTDVCIYDGWAMIPAAFTWEQGKKYIYTFVFGEGDFGYNGGIGDTPTPDGKKVLTTMNYKVDVEDFIEPENETDEDREIIL